MKKTILITATLFVILILAHDLHEIALNGAKSLLLRNPIVFLGFFFIAATGAIVSLSNQKK